MPGPTPLRVKENPATISLAGEVSRGRAPVANEDLTEPVKVPHLVAPSSDIPPPRKRASSRGDRSKREGRADESDGWPTADALKPAELPAGLPETVIQPTDVASGAQPEGAPGVVASSTPVRPTQAAHVLVWREADGSVHITPIGSPAPTDAVEAILAALAPEVDLAALLR